MAAQTVGTEDPSHRVSACEGGPANPATRRVALKHVAEWQQVSLQTPSALRRMAPPGSLMAFRLFNIHFLQKVR